MKSTQPRKSLKPEAPPALPLTEPVRLPHGRVVHTTRGRVRLQFSKENRHLLQSISARLGDMAQVMNVELRPATGSLIIKHTADAPDFVPSLQEFVQNAGLFLLQAEYNPTQSAGRLTAVERDAHYLVEHSRLGESVLRYTEHLNRGVKQLTEGWIDLRVLLPLTVGVIALLVVNVESAPMWLPLALFSYQSFSNLHQPSPAVQVAPQNALPAPTPVTIEAVRERSS